MSVYVFYFLCLSCLDESLWCKDCVKALFRLSCSLLFFSLPFHPIYILSSLCIRQEALVSNGKIRIIPFVYDAGQEECDESYEELGKQLIEDFLEKSHRTRSWQETTSPRLSKRQGFSHHERSRLPDVPCYPEEYDTIDRRRKKKLRYNNFEECGRTGLPKRDILGLSSGTVASGSVRTRMERQMHPDYLENETYRSSPIESEEQLPGYPVLRPYKNGLLVKSGKLANSKQASSHSGSARFGAEDKAHPEETSNCFVPLDVLEEFDSSASDELQNSPVSDEEDEMEEIAILSQAWRESSMRQGLPGDFTGHHARRALSLLHREKKPHRARGGKYGGLKQDMTLSPVEEPTEEYVDAMDELQCLVETVSEYLAEKEEEMSKIGTLENSKNASEGAPFPQASAGDKPVGEGAPPEQAKDAKLASAAEDRGSSKGVSEALPDLTGVKNTVNSLFSSLTEKVGSGTKHLTASVERLVASVPEKSEAPSEGGTASLLPTKPKSDGASAEVEAKGKADTPLSAASPSSSGKAAGEASVASAAQDPPAPPAQSPFSSQGPGSVVNSVLGMFNPLKIFSEKEAPQRDTVKQEEISSVKIEISHASAPDVKGEEKLCEDDPKPTSGSPNVSLSQKPLPQAAGGSEATATTGSGPVSSLFGKLSSSVSSFSLKASLENLAVPKPPAEPQKPPDAPQISNQPGKIDKEHPDASGNQPLAGKVLGSKQNDSKKETSAQPAAPGESPDNFFSPLKKSFSQLLLPSSSSESMRKETPLGLGKSHQSEDDIRKTSSTSSEPNFPFTGKLQIPFLSGFGFSDSKQQDNKEKPGIFASVLKAVSVENLAASKDQTDQPISSLKPQNAEMDSKASNLEVVKTDSSRSSSVPAAPESKEKLLRRKDSVTENGWCAPESGNRKQVVSDTSRTVHKEHDHHPVRAQGHREDPKGGEPPVAAVPKTSDLQAVVEKPMPAGGVGEGRTMDSPQKKPPQQGLLSGLFRRASSDHIIHKEEPNDKRETDSQTSGSPGLLSGFLRFASNENVSECRSEKTKTTPLGGIMKIFERNEEVPGSGDKPVNSHVDPSSQESTGGKQEPPNFIRSRMPKPKAKVEEGMTEIYRTKEHLPNTDVKKMEPERGPCQRRSASQYALSLQEKAHDLSEKAPLYRRGTISNIYQSVITERSSEFMNSSLANAKMYGQSGQYLSLEDTRPASSCEWEYAAGGFSANAHQIPLPVYYVLNQNSVPLAEFLDWSESNETVMNLCKKDGNANTVDWRSNASLDMQSVDFSVMSYESLDQLGFQDACLEENEAWATHSLDGSLPPFDRNYILEDVPMDLSYSSAWDGNRWTLIDEESLSTDGSYGYSSYSQEYQDWLVLLERGVWWPSEDGVCGYYMYSDGLYVYSLLTDLTGQYVYICMPDTDTQPEFWDYSYPEDTWQNSVLEDDMIAICGFKVPLSNEDELFWFAEEEPLDNDFGNKPLDLSVALQRSDQLMNMNLETFSQMFEESMYYQREQPLDFSGYKLQKLKVDLRPEKELERHPEEPPLMLDLRVHSRTTLSGKMKEDARSRQADRTPDAIGREGGQSRWFGFHIFPSSAHVEPPAESQSKTEVTMAEEDKKPPVNKVTSLFSALGGLIPRTSEGHDESLEDVAVKKAGGHSELLEHKKDGLSARTPRRTGEEVQTRPPVSAEGQSEVKGAATSARIDSAKNEKPVRRPSARQKKAELARSPSHITWGPAENKLHQLENHHKPPAILSQHKPRVSLEEPKRTQAAPSQTAPESEGMIFKSALKIFSLGEDSSSATSASDKSEGPGFFDFFKTQVNKAPPPSPSPQPSPAPQPGLMKKEAEKKPQGKAETSGISSFFGSIGDLFKVDAAPSPPSATIPPPKRGSQSSPEIKARADHGGREQSKNTVSTSPAPAWQAGVGVAMEPMAPSEEPPGVDRKEAVEPPTIPSGSPEPKPSRDAEHKPRLRVEHKPPMHTGPGVGRTNQPPAHPRHGPASSSGQPEGVQTGATADKTQPSKGSQQEKESGFNLPFGFSQAAAAPSKPQQAQPSASRSIFSFFSAPEKAPAPAPAVPNAKPPEDEGGLFRIPSFLSGGPTAKKNMPQSSSSFSFFSLTSFLDEKPPAAPPTGNLAQSQKTSNLAKSHPQQPGVKPSMKPGVSVDSDMGRARQQKLEKQDAAAVGVIEAVLGKKEAAGQQDEAGEPNASIVEEGTGSAQAGPASRHEHSETREAAAVPGGQKAAGLQSAEDIGSNARVVRLAAESVSEARAETEGPPVASQAPPDDRSTEDQSVSLEPGFDVPKRQAENGPFPLAVAPPPTDQLQGGAEKRAEGALSSEKEDAPSDQNRICEDGGRRPVEEGTSVDVAAAEAEGHLLQEGPEVKPSVPEVKLSDSEQPDNNAPAVAGLPTAEDQRPPPKAPAGSPSPEKPKEVAESDRSVLDTSVEMFSSFMTKMKPTKTLSGFFSPSQQAPAAPSAQKKSTSFFGLSSLPSGPSPSFTSDLFGMFKGAAEEASSKPGGLSKPQDPSPGAREAARPGGLSKGSAKPDQKISGAEPSAAKAPPGLLKEPDGVLQGEPQEGGTGGVLKQEGTLLWPGGTSTEERPATAEAEVKEGPEEGQEHVLLSASETRLSSKDQDLEGTQREAPWLASDAAKKTDRCGQEMGKAADTGAAVSEEKTEVSVEPLGKDGVPAAEEDQAVLEQEADTSIAHVSGEGTPGGLEPQVDKAEERPPESSPVEKEAEVEVRPSESSGALEVESEVAANEVQGLPGEEKDPTLETTSSSPEHKDALKEVPLRSSLAQESKPAGVPTEAGHPKPVFEIPSMPTLPKFNFMSSTESSKPFGSFFSPPQPSGSKGAAEPGIMSTFNKFSSSLFGGTSDEKAGKAEGGQGASPFGKKLDFSLLWQKEAGATKEPEARLKMSSRQERPPGASSERDSGASETSPKPLEQAPSGMGTQESPDLASTGRPAEPAADSDLSSKQPDGLAKEGLEGPASATEEVTSKESAAAVPGEPEGSLRGGVSAEPSVSSWEEPSEEAPAVQDLAEQKQSAPGPEAEAWAPGLPPAEIPTAEPPKRKRPVARMAS